ncbi:MAG: adenine deaminase C-terminal domain-containing protein, partial [Chloroflexota bacterium]
ASTVKGFGLRSGALATSIAHDSHNIVAVGTNDGDIYGAAKEVERLQGGVVAVQGGKVLASPYATLSFLALPVIPELRLTDKGMVDVLAFKLID